MGLPVGPSIHTQPSRKYAPYRVKVHDEESLRLMLQDNKPSSPNSSFARSLKSKPSFSIAQIRTEEAKLKAGQSAKKKRLQQQYRQQVAQHQLKQERLLKDKLLQAAAGRERHFLDLRDEISRGQQFVAHLDRVLGIADEAERSKKLKQYQEWNANVHLMIQGRIDDAVKALDPKAINEQRRGDLEKFLSTTRSKAAVFLDIIIESEYDPLEPNRRAIKARLGNLRDPCVRVLAKRDEEKKLLAGEGEHPMLPLGRETLDVDLWAERKIKDTPHGFFAKIMNREGGEGSQGKTGGVVETSATYKTTFKMDDYNIERGRAVTSEEFPKGKKTFGGRGDDDSLDARVGQNLG